MSIRDQLSYSLPDLQILGVSVRKVLPDCYDCFSQLPIRSRIVRLHLTVCVNGQKVSVIFILTFIIFYCTYTYAVQIQLLVNQVICVVYIVLYIRFV